MWFTVSVGMDCCHFSSSSAHHMGMLVDSNSRSRHYWFGSNHGWDCSSFGILFNHAMVENTVAKLKYALSESFYLKIFIQSSKFYLIILDIYGVIFVAVFFFSLGIPFTNVILLLKPFILHM